MRRLGSQSGEGRAGCLLWVLVLLSGILVASRVIPVTIAKAELKDYIVDISQRHPRWTARRISKKLVDRAEELDLPLHKKNVKVRKTADRMVVELSFVTPLDFYVYTWNWNHHIEEARDIFYF